MLDVFEPVVVRELSANADLHNAFLDLDTGKVTSAPAEFLAELKGKGQLYGGDPSAGAVRDFMQKTGMDIIASTNAKAPAELKQVDGLVDNIGEKSSPQPGHTFDTVSAADVRRFLKPAQSSEPVEVVPRLWMHRPNSPTAFQTREGRVGVLEILEARPDRVKLRYKLVAVAAQPSRRHPPRRRKAAPASVPAAPEVTLLDIEGRPGKDGGVATGWQPAPPKAAHLPRTREGGPTRT